MFPVDTIVVSTRIDELVSQSAAERLARLARPASHRANPVASVFRAVWSNLTGPAARPMNLPELSDYPFRG